MPLNPTISTDSSVSRPAIIAIPACNEQERITPCLAAIALQRDWQGRRVSPKAYRVLVFANNCVDATAQQAREAGQRMNLSIDVLEATTTPLKAAGLARRRVMDEAADRLEAEGLSGGVILTTDADSTVSPTWVAANLAEFEAGADCVAGYIDADPLEFVGLGMAFQGRGFLEEHYHALVSEIFALLDPRPHDPWPNHQVSSGASLGITLAMYRKIGGLPAHASGEDAALALVVECAEGKVRHAMSVCVSTSCRLDGRAMGGAADTMRLRHAVDETPCDDALEPAFTIARKAWLKGHLRRTSHLGFMRESTILAGLGLRTEQIDAALANLRETCFEVFWQHLCRISPTLQFRTALRPSMLPAEIARAEALLKYLRAQTEPLKAIDFVMENSVTFEARLHSLQE
ncbi:glycosyltransferase [Labrys miyagiensis]